MRNIHRNHRIAATAIRTPSAWPASSLTSAHAPHADSGNKMTPSALAAITGVLLLLTAFSALGAIAFVLLRT
ncbi:MAG: hypothetical protein ACRCTI_07460 [Beijerinckiaceae bacterium]